MAKGIPGADSSQVVTQQLIDGATKIFGQAPQFWGRYFKSPTGGSSAEYRHLEENPVLSQANIKLLPVAQQTSHVGGTQALGTADATGNVDDFLATFSQELLVAQGGQFLMFLDVEGLPQQGNPSLALPYYTGWAQTLVTYSQSQTNNAVTILPCVYARTGDDVTWNALNHADANGVKCNGAWVARYPGAGACSSLDFNDAFALPSVTLPCSVLIWQFSEDCNNGTIDLNQTNPNVDAQGLLLSKLVLPPATSPATTSN